MKLIIDIPEEAKKNIDTFKGKFICEGEYDLIDAVKNSTLLDDVKAEIEQFREDLAEKAPSLKDLINAQQTVDVCLGIIDNIGKGE